MRSEYSGYSLESAFVKGTISKDDVDLIKGFLIERRSSANLSPGRINKLTFTLVSWRRFIGQFRDLGIVDVYTGIEALKNGTSARNKPFKPNTIADHVIILKQFILWMIEEGYSKIPEKKITRIKNPPKDMVTKKATDLLTPDEITLIMKACDRSGDRAKVPCVPVQFRCISPLGRRRGRMAEER